MKKFSVVCFINENAFDIVPTTWLSGPEEIRMCYWPPESVKAQVAKMVKKCTDPRPDWEKFSVKVLVQCGMLSPIFWSNCIES